MSNRGSKDTLQGQENLLSCSKTDPKQNFGRPHIFALHGTKASTFTFFSTTQQNAPKEQMPNWKCQGHGWWVWQAANFTDCSGPRGMVLKIDNGCSKCDFLKSSNLIKEPGEPPHSPRSRVPLEGRQHNPTHSTSTSRNHMMPWHVKTVCTQKRTYRGTSEGTTTATTNHQPPTISNRQQVTTHKLESTSNE